MSKNKIRIKCILHLKRFNSITQRKWGKVNYKVGQGELQSGQITLRKESEAMGITKWSKGITSGAGNNRIDYALMI